MNVHCDAYILYKDKAFAASHAYSIYNTPNTDTCNTHTMQAWMRRRRRRDREEAVKSDAGETIQQNIFDTT